MTDTHKLVKGKSGRDWIVSLQTNAADRIYVTNNPENKVNGRRDFAGYGGATLKFKLEDGSEFEAHGPWHANPDGLFEDTGLDLRSLSLTKILIAKSIRYDSERGYRPVFEDIIYSEDQSVLGEFNRGDVIAQQLSNLLGEKLVVHSVSQGGSSIKHVNPES